MTFGDFQLSTRPGGNLTATVPVLPSRDLGKTATLYEALGFETILIAEGGGYLIARMQWVELHFWPFPALDPARNYASTYLRVSDADLAAAPFAEHAAKVPGCRFVPAKDEPWGMRQASFIDPDGNLLHIGSPENHQKWPK